MLREPKSKMTALVVNCSAPHYSLGAEKLADWLRQEGHNVECAGGDPGMFIVGYDLVAVSVVFSWHAEIALEAALRAKREGAEVWAGGPGLYALRGWFEERSGIKPQWKPDARFEHQRGNYKMVYAVRGCAGEYIASLQRFHPCEWCIVPKVEGTRYTLDEGFQPAPVLLDNNLSGQPVPTQEHIIAKYMESGVPLRDANSGFEPSVFDEGTLARWDRILQGPWRFGFDHSREYESAKRMATMLKDYKPNRKRVYVMVGNETVQACYERCRQVIEWGCEPHCQFEMPLDALDKDDDSRWNASFVAKYQERGWTIGLGRDFCRFFNRFLWRNMSLAEYAPRIGEVAPFKGMIAA
jgi:hypothetical protein